MVFRCNFFFITTLSLIGVACMASAQVNSQTPGYFPFWIPPFDATPSFTDLSFLNPEPAGTSGRVTVKDAHFVDGQGKRVLLLGTNLTFGTAFPKKDDAPRIAAHMRKMGMNVVRFHHLDMQKAPGGLWQPGLREFDMEQLDKLDWLIYQLIQHGIYVNINLHVSRTYPGIPGNLPETFNFGKGLDNFYPEFIELQKKYAHDLLTHRNPYLKANYAEAPGVIVVEINNENSLSDKSWGDLRNLPEPYIGELTRQWRSWLGSRYESTEALRAAWSEGAEPLGRQLLQNADFEADRQHWTGEQGSGAKLSVDIIDVTGDTGGRAVRVTTQRAGGVPWSLQFHQTGLDLENGASYTLSFRARSDAARTIVAHARMDQAPWAMVGLTQSLELNTRWQDFSMSFMAAGSVPEHTRISFDFQNQLGQFEFTKMSLRSGGMTGLKSGHSLKDNNIPFLADTASLGQRVDFSRFIQETECAYVADMVRYVKEDLKVGALVCDSQASYGGLLGRYRESTYSDFIDMHAYWQHPHFPGRSWDGANWRIDNTSMVAEANTGTLGNLAWYRDVTKPYTVSEYNHPAPSDYAVEQLPMLASFAARQDWDGLYQFDYGDSARADRDHRIQGYFTMVSHPGVLAFLPAAAIMFRMDTVTPAGGNQALHIHSEDVARQNLLWGGDSGSDMLALRPNATSLRVGYSLKGGSGAPKPGIANLEGDHSNEDIFSWSAPGDGTGRYTVMTPAVRLALGHIAGQELKLGNVTVQVEGPESTWAAVAVSALDGEEISKSRRILVAVVGRVENSDMAWNAERNTVGANWGHAPAVAEGIRATLVLPRGKRVFALDGTGTPKGEVPHKITKISEELYQLSFTSGPEHGTLWYGIE
jgi:hypothetical protein